MPGHMPNAAIDDCHAMLKVGGLLVTCMRNSMWQNDVAEGYKEKFMSLVNSGKFAIYKHDNFYRGTEGGLGLFGKQLSDRIVFCKRADWACQIKYNHPYA